MPVNPYFSEHKVPAEQDLIESVTIEMIQLSGMDIYYVPRTYFNPDNILNEDINSKFTAYFQVEMYLNNATQYGGANYYFQKFGVMIDNTMEWVVSRKRFSELTNLPYPKEGDLLYVPMNKALLQIGEVSFETTPYFQLQKNYVYTLKSTLFTYSHETISTGLPALDQQAAIIANTFDNPDPFAENDTINNEAKNVDLDFDESNPFGEITE